MAKFFQLFILIPLFLYVPLNVHSSTPEPDKIDSGKQFFHNGEIEKSYKIFKELFFQNPDNQTINFYLGRSAFELNKFEEAIFAYERMLISDPDLTRVKLEMARAYMSAGSNEEAKRLFKEVLTTNPPENVKENVELMLKKIESREQKHKLSGSIELGYGFDDNTSSSPTDEIIEIPAFSYLPMKVEGEESDYFFTSSADISYIYNLESQVLNRFKTSFFYQKNLYNSKNEQDLDFISLAFTPNFTVLPGLFLDTSVIGQHIRIDSQNYLNSLGAKFDLKKIISDSSLINLGISYSQKKYDSDYESRDGSSSGVYISYTKGIKNFLLTPFMDFAKESADSDLYSFNRLSGGLGFLWLITQKINFSGFYRYQQSEYEEKDSLFLEKREDKTSFLSGDIKWMCFENREKTLAAFLGLSHLFINNNSNADIYEYKKNKTAAYFKVSF
ncbi:MAG: tetratricopeptide repeat protein [Desulfobacteraceae bacterium]|nr:tetratricopeptide repeat protein [Desulfobacteraceae bacterium]